MKNANNKKIRTLIRASVLVLVLVIALCPFLRLSVGAEGLYEAGSEEFFSSRDLIARVVECIAPDRSYAARQAIAAVIVNRIKDSRFPSDLYSVIYQRGAFECVSKEGFDRVTPSYLSKVAARDALLGFDISSGAVYFRRGYPSERAGSCFYHDGYLFYR